jgi:hypothetical protein
MARVNGPGGGAVAMSVALTLPETSPVSMAPRTTAGSHYSSLRRGGAVEGGRIGDMGVSPN